MDTSGHTREAKEGSPMKPNENFEEYVVGFAKVIKDRVDGVFDEGIQVTATMRNKECRFLTALGAILDMYLEEKE